MLESQLSVMANALFASSRIRLSAFVVCLIRRMQKGMSGLVTYSTAMTVARRLSAFAALRNLMLGGYLSGAVDQRWPCRLVDSLIRRLDGWSARWLDCSMADLLGTWQRRYFAPACPLILCGLSGVLCPWRLNPTSDTSCCTANVRIRA